MTRAEEKKDNLVCQQQIEDLTRRLQGQKERDLEEKERTIEKEREKVAEWERQREKERNMDRKERERERESARERERMREREREAEQRRQNDKLREELQGLKRERRLEEESSPGKSAEKEMDGKDNQSGEKKKNNFWDGSDFLMATETSFDRMQKKMKEIQQVVAGLDTVKKVQDVVDTEKGAQDVVTGLTSESVTFEKMMKKMDDIASLDCGWEPAEDTQGDHFRHAGEEDSGAGWVIGTGSPKKRVAARHQTQRSWINTVGMDAGAAGSEIIHRSPFRPIPPPRDARLDHLFGQIDSLQSEWRGPRPRPTQGADKPIEVFSPLAPEVSAASRAPEILEITSPSRQDIQLTFSSAEREITKVPSPPTSNSAAPAGVVRTTRPAIELPSR